MAHNGNSYHPHGTDKMSFSNALAGLIEGSKHFFLKFFILFIETWENAHN